ncbi:MAG: hypothetical protein LAP85_17305 [Acidobacteriia bacterium]|nr:hypothetical protein [Terriglobia bacterium]
MEMSHGPGRAVPPGLGLKDLLASGFFVKPIQETLKALIHFVVPLLELCQLVLSQDRLDSRP